MGTFCNFMQSTCLALDHIFEDIKSTAKKYRNSFND